MEVVLGSQEHLNVLRPWFPAPLRGNSYDKLGMMLAGEANPLRRPEHLPDPEATARVFCRMAAQRAVRIYLKMQEVLKALEENHPLQQDPGPGVMFNGVYGLDPARQG